mmetsp:Transcript_17389/g.33960  ORF Transcript_17389/g.33960 Transcript_17389/m.33960 type:complete len:93 (-) Transcript_17389:395-673(-)
MWLVAPEVLVAVRAPARALARAALTRAASADETKSRDDGMGFVKGAGVCGAACRTTEVWSIVLPSMMLARADYDQTCVQRLQRQACFFVCNT